MHANYVSQENSWSIFRHKAFSSLYRKVMYIEISNRQPSSSDKMAFVQTRSLRTIKLSIQLNFINTILILKRRPPSKILYYVFCPYIIQLSSVYSQIHDEENLLWFSPNMVNNSLFVHRIPDILDYTLNYGYKLRKILIVVCNYQSWFQIHQRA